jgi:hypothetical protein
VYVLAWGLVHALSSTASTGIQQAVPRKAGAKVEIVSKSMNCEGLRVNDGDRWGVQIRSDWLGSNQDNKVAKAIQILKGKMCWLSVLVMKRIKQ